jgi:hypothetical protein
MDEVAPASEMLEANRGRAALSLKLLVCSQRARE